jgi:Zn-finger nucleic acid-binding protein
VANVMAKCPVCDMELVTRYFGVVEVRHCQGCGGHWVQRNRLGAVLQRYMRFIAKRRDESCGLRDRVNPWEVEGTPRRCPECARDMRKLNYAYNSNVIVDDCLFCNGTWFDQGEIEKIADFLKNSGMPERLKQEFEEIKTIYDHHERQEALEMLKDVIVWILSFVLGGGFLSFRG